MIGSRLTPLLRDSRVVADTHCPCRRMSSLTSADTVTQLLL